MHIFGGCCSAATTSIDNACLHQLYHAGDDKVMIVLPFILYLLGGFTLFERGKSSLSSSVSLLYSPTHPFPSPFSIPLFLDITVNSWTSLYVLALLFILCSWQAPVVFEHFTISWKKKFQSPFVLSHFSCFFEKFFFLLVNSGIHYLNQWTEVANTRPAGWIQSSTLFYLARTLFLPCGSAELLALVNE